MKFIDNNDTFLVVGASSGIGRQVVLRLNNLGYNVVAVARRKDKLEELIESCSNPNKVVIEIKDIVEDIDDLPRWILQLTQQYGKLKGMVLSAGIQQIVPLKAISYKKSKELFDINYFANVLLIKGFCDKRVNIAPSSVVLLSSIASISGNSGIINYSASKGAINSAVKSMAVEVAKQGIRINAVLPGLVKTELLEKWNAVYTSEYLEEENNNYPLGIGNPEDVADPICFLLSDDARWITGQSIVVDGGGSL